MTWTQIHSARLLSPLVALACFFSATSPVAADTITQSDADRIGNAVAAALQGEKLYTFPYDEYSVVPLSEFLATDPFDISTSIAHLLEDWGITINNYLTSDLLPAVSGIRDSVGTSETSLASILDTLIRVQGDTSTYLQYLSPIDFSLTALDRYLDTDYRWTSQSGDALRVHDDELLDAILDLRTENDSNHYDQMQGMGNYYGDVSNALASLAVDVGAIVDTLEDGGSLSGLGSDIMPDAELGPADTENISAPSVVGISTANLDADLTTMNLTGGDSVITFWEETELAGWTVPAATLDLASPRMSRAVSRLRDISVTLWWLSFFTAVYLLCRREITYYASLAHTEGN